MSIALPVAELPNISSFCERWRVQELSLFGSILTARFDDKSDIDMLVTFRSDASWSLLDMVQAEAELSELMGRPVDLVEKSVVEKSENWIRRREILKNTKSIYAH